MKAESIKPGDIRFIKLGEKGKWESESIVRDCVIRLDYISNLHQECLRVSGTQ